MQDSQAVWSASSFRSGASQSPPIAVPLALVRTARWEAANPSGPHPDILTHRTRSQPRSTLAHQPRPMDTTIQPQLINQLPQPAFRFPLVPISARNQTTPRKDMALPHPSAVSRFHA
jgi:hypothetical protein